MQYLHEQNSVERFTFVVIIGCLFVFFLFVLSLLFLFLFACLIVWQLSLFSYDNFFCLN